MTPEEKREMNNIMEILVSKLDNKIEITNVKSDAKFDIINNKLDAITEQTKKTNGRVNKLEDRLQVIDDGIYDKLEDVESKINTLKNNDMEHILHCPLSSKVKELEDQQISSKTMKKVIIGGITIIATIVGIILGLMKIFTGNFD